ncbi:MAG: tRNA (guanosine(37)-N1)-methyltransferase TrmD [Gemmatimonadota bacterium]|nr:tRNA (guanosine(37)-N1)-methyltransferase TrmD [Gemmatimonadota bacterium]
MRIDVITIFPDLIRDVLKYSIPRRAIDAGLIDVLAHDLRDHANDKHKTIDDTPYGGGAGMIFKPEPIARAIEALPTGGRVIFLTPQGRLFTQSVANELSLSDHLVLLCGHYRGIDERVRKNYVDDEISIGDYVLSGGELPALILIDALIRLIPGAIGNAESALEDSFQNSLLDCAWYTRPREFEGLTVPEALLSGDHKKVAQWRRDNARKRTLERRPDLLE